jgi:hypothetical protein
MQAGAGLCADKNFYGLLKRIHFNLAKTLIFRYNEYRK